MQYGCSMIWWSAYPDIFGYTQPQFGLPQTSIDTGLVIYTEQHGQKLAPKPRSRSETLTHKRLDAKKKCCNSEGEACWAPVLSILPQDWASESSSGLQCRKKPIYLATDLHGLRPLGSRCGASWEILQAVSSLQGALEPL
jgi:hypothetical protein